MDTIHTSGGDYAEGDIDKRQGSFVEGQVQGPVVKHNSGLVTIINNTGSHYHLPCASTPVAPAFQTPYPPNPLFTGRAAELDKLAAILLATQAQNRCTVVGYHRPRRNWQDPTG